MASAPDTASTKPASYPSPTADFSPPLRSSSNAKSLPSLKEILKALDEEAEGEAGGEAEDDTDEDESVMCYEYNVRDDPDMDYLSLAIVPGRDKRVKAIVEMIMNEMTGRYGRVRGLKRRHPSDISEPVYPVSIIGGSRGAPTGSSRVRPVVDDDEELMQEFMNLRVGEKRRR